MKLQDEIVMIVVRNNFIMQVVVKVSALSEKLDATSDMKLCGFIIMNNNEMNLYMAYREIKWKNR